jgi:hypothetical protein
MKVAVLLFLPLSSSDQTTIVCQIRRKKVIYFGCNAMNTRFFYALFPSI